MRLAINILTTTHTYTRAYTHACTESQKELFYLYSLICLTPYSCTKNTNKPVSFWKLVTLYLYTVKEILNEHTREREAESTESLNENETSSTKKKQATKLLGDWVNVFLFLLFIY